MNLAPKPKFYIGRPNIQIDDTKDNADVTWSAYRILNEISKKTNNIKLRELFDVEVNELKNGYMIVYNKETDKFEAKEYLTYNTISSLEDVDTSNLDNNYILIFNKDTNKWTSKLFSINNLNLTELNDVNLSNIKHDDLIRYNEVSKKFEPYSLDLRNTYYYTVQYNAMNIEANIGNPKILELEMPFSTRFNYGKIEVLYNPLNSTSTVSNQLIDFNLNMEHDIAVSSSNITIDNENHLHLITETRIPVVDRTEVEDNQGYIYSIKVPYGEVDKFNDVNINNAGLKFLLWDGESFYDSNMNKRGNSFPIVNDFNNYGNDSIIPFLNITTAQLKQVEVEPIFKNGDYEEYNLNLDNFIEIKDIML